MEEPFARACDEGCIRLKDADMGNLSTEHQTARPARALSDGAPTHSKAGAAAPAGDGDDAARWAAVVGRDAQADGAFVYAVRTTGVYCRPSCPARRPKRENVRFFALTREAERAGYRACARCRPSEPSTAQRQARAVEAACAALREDPALPLARLASSAGLSSHHFHRVFKAHTGLTPRAFARGVRTKTLASAFAEGARPVDAAFAAGFNSLSQLYDEAAQSGLTPSALARGAPGEVIVTGAARCSLGGVHVAFSRVGIAAVHLDVEGSPSAGVTFDALFANALLIEGGADFDRLVASVVRAIEEPALAAELPLDVRGTAFECRVFAALRKIPVGTSATYGEIAAAVGAPRAHRAVARACASNRVAVLIPCHRVVRADGALSGYRWGVDTRRALLEAEASHG